MGASAQTGDPTDLPVLSADVPRGAGTIETGPAVTPTVKTIDGAISDWTGTGSGYAGTLLYSHGELIYQDHLFDAYGADDGRDAQRTGLTDPLEEEAPSTYRIDALMAQADAPGQLGIDTPPQVSYDDTYGDTLDHQDHADLNELRLASDGQDLFILARTTTLRPEDRTALLLLADTGGDPATREIPFNSGLSSEVADVAVFLTGTGGRVVDLASGQEIVLAEGSVARNDSDFVNALEARIPGSLLAGESLSLTAATGTAASDGAGFEDLALEEGNGDNPNVANVAFRFDEPVRTWFDKQQALALHAAPSTRSSSTSTSPRSPPASPRRGRRAPATTTASSPRSERISREQGLDGIHQHYGVYLPEADRTGSPLPLQWWLHWRGGNAHTAGAVIPGCSRTSARTDSDRHLAAAAGARRRGTSARPRRRRRGVGRRARPLPDRRGPRVRHRPLDGRLGLVPAVGAVPRPLRPPMPVAGPVTQGAWTGVDVPGCDDLPYERTTRPATSPPTAAAPATSTRGGCSRTSATSRSRSSRAPPTSSSRSAA